MADTKTEKTIAEELREAAAKLREEAENTTRGPWTRTADFTPNEAGDAESGENDIAHRHGDYLDTVALVGSGTTATADAKWICLTNPLLAEPLASWLEQAAATFDREVIDDAPECPNCGEGCSGHPDALVHDEGCGYWLADARDERCRCFDNALATARVINGTAPQEVSAR